jgi:hypothetical protein
VDFVNNFFLFQRRVSSCVRDFIFMNADLYYGVCVYLCEQYTKIIRYTPFVIITTVIGINSGGWRSRLPDFGLGS